MLDTFENLRPIGMILPDRSFYYPSLHAAAQAYAEKINQQLVVIYLSDQIVDLNDLLRDLDSRCFAGIIVMLNVDEYFDSYLDSIKASKIPFVLINSDFDSDCDCVGLDWLNLSKNATEQLGRCLSKPHRIAFMSNSEIVAGRQTVQGYREALRDLRISFDPRLLIHCKSEYQDIYDACNLLLNSKLPPKAILCENTIMAKAAKDAVEHLGMYVPEDIPIAVLIANGEPTDEYFFTSADAKVSDISRKAIDLLLERIYVEDWSTKKLTVHTSLKLRDSSYQRNTKRPKECKF